MNNKDKKKVSCNNEQLKIKQIMKTKLYNDVIWRSVRTFPFYLLFKKILFCQYV